MLLAMRNNGCRMKYHQQFHGISNSWYMITYQVAGGCVACSVCKLSIWKINFFIKIKDYWDILQQEIFINTWYIYIILYWWYEINITALIVFYIVPWKCKYCYKYWKYTQLLIIIQRTLSFICEAHIVGNLYIMHNTVHKRHYTQVITRSY